MNGSKPLARFTVHLDQEMGERLKNAAAARGLSVAAVCKGALCKAVLEMEHEHNAGQPFPERVRLFAPLE